MMAEVVTLYQNNFRDPVFSLRAIADEIDEGKYGEVGCVGIVVMGDTTEVFGAGPDSEGPSVATLLYAGFLKLISPMIERHE
jgi:hypothetical protein